MTAVLDATAIVALIADEPGGVEVSELLTAHAGGSCSAVNLAETLDWLVRIARRDPPVARTALEAVISSGIAVVACDQSIALRAGELRGTWYHRRTAPVSLADCIAAATAERMQATLVTSDGLLCRLAADIGVAVHPILNSAGQRHSV